MSPLSSSAQFMNLVVHNTQIQRYTIYGLTCTQLLHLTV
eukprot:SAG11_NODE_31012_length_295_cov_1.566327_1_plen_38_part_10